MERALGSEFNLRGDFFVEDDGIKGDDKGERGGKLTRKFTFQEQLELKRAVTSIDWSPTQPELLLASYNQSDDWSMEEPDGLIDIFSLSL